MHLKMYFYNYLTTHCYLINHDSMLLELYCRSNCSIKMEPFRTFSF